MALPTTRPHVPRVRDAGEDCFVVAGDGRGEQPVRREHAKCGTLVSQDLPFRSIHVPLTRRNADRPIDQALRNDLRVTDSGEGHRRIGPGRAIPADELNISNIDHAHHRVRRAPQQFEKSAALDDVAPAHPGDHVCAKRRYSSPELVDRVGHLRVVLELERVTAPLSTWRMRGALEVPRRPSRATRRILARRSVRLPDDRLPREPPLPRRRVVHLPIRPRGYRRRGRKRVVHLPIRPRGYRRRGPRSRRTRPRGSTPDATSPNLMSAAPPTAGSSARTPATRRSSSRSGA